jgi:predicted CXXCH cytochrome family protein
MYPIYVRVHFKGGILALFPQILFTRHTSSVSINIVGVVLLILLLIPLSLHSTIKSEDCFECHNNYKGFAHRGISCVDCHDDISSIPHKEKFLRPSCKTCHKEITEIYSKNIHEAKRLDCKGCHDVHFLDKETKGCTSCHTTITHKSLPSREKHLGVLECIACHGKAVRSEVEIGIHIKEGKALTRQTFDLDGNNVIDGGEWDNIQTFLSKNLKGAYRIDVKYYSKGSVHGIAQKPIACKNCHTDRGLFSDARLKFSGIISYEIPIESKIFIPKLPSITKYKETVHGKKGIECYDCHISQKHINDSICISCHDELYGIYKDTPHAKKGATKCTDCHNPHSIKTYKELDSKERLTVCSRCHKDYINKHKWLPNTALHFKYLECSTCHSPDSTKSIVFYFGIRERGKEKVLDYADLRDISDRDMNLVSLVDRDKNGVVISRELADFFIELKNRLKKDLFIGSSIIVTKVYHEYSVKGQREKVCATCHSEHAAFYDSMFFILPEKDKYIYIPVKGTTLSALPTSLVIDMFLLGEEKVKIEDFKKLFAAGHKERFEHIRELGLKWIDLLGILLTLLTFLLIIIHAIVRIAKRR